MFQITGISFPGKISYILNNSLNLGGLVSRGMVYAILLSGVYFFVRLVSAGYGYLTSSGDPAKIQSGSKELTNSVIGLLVVISSYFILQILQVVFGFNVKI